MLRKELLKEDSGQHSVLFAEIFKYTENYIYTKIGKIR